MIVLLSAVDKHTQWKKVGSVSHSFLFVCPYLIYIHLSCVHTSSDFVAACRQGLAMRSLAGVLTTGCLDSKLGFLPLHTNILVAKY